MDTEEITGIWVLSEDKQYLINQSTGEIVLLTRRDTEKMPPVYLIEDEETDN